MKFKHLLYIFRFSLFSALLCLLSCEAGDELRKDEPYFVKFFGGSSQQAANDFIAMPDQGFVVAGVISDKSGKNIQALLLRTDKNCNWVWQKSFGDVQNDRFLSLVRLDDAIIAVGYTESTDKKNQILIVKTDFNGNQIFNKTYGVTGYEARVCILCKDGNIAIGGFYNKREVSENVNARDGIFLMKISPQGDSLWSKNFGSNDYELISSIYQDNDENLYVLGTTNIKEASKPEGSIYLKKLNNNGQALDSLIISAKTNDFSKSMFIHPDGNIYLLATTNSKREISIVKTPVNNLQDYKLGRVITTSLNNTTAQFILTKNNEMAILGSLGNIPSRDMFLLRFSMNFDPIDEEILGMRQSEDGVKLIENPDESICVLSNSIAGNAFSFSITKVSKYFKFE